MAKTTEGSTPAKNGNAKARKTTKRKIIKALKSPSARLKEMVSEFGTEQMSPVQRAAAVNKNIGKSQPLHDFLASIGWR
ncbi:MAG TPA: hypothetical protein VH988_01250 [Thermoanaerobaculia bacterium]|jgi:hypothetical protein|nr:hypothetical protein [Thermoanaerobaculia bacterium]